MNNDTTAKVQTDSKADEALEQKIKSDDWSRVSPIAVLYFFIKSVYFFVNGVLIYSLPLFALNFDKVKDNILAITLGFGSLMLVFLASAILKYLFYFYRLSEDRVEIKQGVIQKSHLDLPFEKIQNVKIIQPFYYRFSDFSIIELDTAGSAQKEVNIVAIRLPLAESFKQRVQKLINPISQSTSHQLEEGVKASASNDGEEILNQRSIKDLVIHGITNNRVWIFLGFLAPFYNTIADNIGNILAAAGINIASYLDYETQSMGIFLLHVLSLVMVLMLFVVTFSIIGAIFVFYNYRLSKHGDRYIRRSGLLSKHEVSMKCTRIQRSVHQQDWLDILIGRVNLSFEQNTAGVPGANQSAQLNSASKLLVPSVTPDEADTITQDVFNVPKLSQVSFSSISPRFIIRLLLYPAVPLFFLPISLLSFGYAESIGAERYITFAIIFSIFLLAISGCVLRWYRWGYARDEDYIYVRKGFFGRDFLVFPIRKLQQTKCVQTPFMRRAKLSTVQFVLASGGIKIPYMPNQDALNMIDNGLQICATEKPAWM